MKQLIKNVKLLSVFLLVFSFMGCEDEDVELPKVTAGFTYTLNPDLGLVTFINTSENADNYMWSFGDETESTEVNPTKRYEQDGSYEVTLKATNVAGASETFKDTIEISIPKPLTLPISFDDNVEYITGVQGTGIEGNVSFAIIDNPELSGANATASKVGQITNVGTNWENAFFNLATPVDFSENKSIKLKLYSTTALPVKLKFEGGSVDPVEADANHGGTGWEELIFTLVSDTSYSDMVLFVDGPGVTAGTFYVDDIRNVATVDVVAPIITLNGDAMMTVVVGETFTDPGATASDDQDGDISANIVVAGDTVDVNTVGSYTITYNVSDAAGNAATEVTRTVEVTEAPSAPTSAAPTPEHPAADVISVYSDAYTDISGTDFNPDWGQATVQSETQVAGDNVQLYTGLTFQGIMLGSAQDVSSMEFLHIDYWTANSTALNAFLISSGPAETAKALTVPTNGAWMSVDIPLSDFAGVDLADVFQMKFDGNGDIYLDNIYFYKTASSSTAPTVAAPTPTHAAADVVSVYSDAYTDISGTDFNPDWGQATVQSETQVAGDNVQLYTGLTFQGIMLGSAQDVSSMEFLHIDYWTANSTALNAFLISPGPAETAKALTVPTNGNWTSVDIPLSDFAGVDLADVIQMKFDGNGDIYLDNIYFYKTASSSTVPTSAAPTPTHAAADVVSVYSDAYTDISGTDFNPDWGQATVQSETQVAGDNVQLHTGLTFQGIMLGSAQDVSSMEFLHIDYWTANSTALNAFLISSGPAETAKALTVPTNGNWTSVDIPLSDFAGVDLADVIQMKFDGNGDIYLDNIYFYKTAGSGGGGTGNVVSIFHDDFTDITIDTWGPDWGASSARIVDGTLNGSPAKVINMEAGKTFAGIDFASSAFDASNFTTFHIQYKVDVLLPGQVFNVKLSNHDGGAGETSAIQYTSVPSDTNVVTLSIPLSDFVAASNPSNLARNAIAQIVISAAREDVNQGVNITIDSIYFSE